MYLGRCRYVLGKCEKCDFEGPLGGRRREGDGARPRYFIVPTIYGPQQNTAILEGTQCTVVSEIL